MRRRRQRPLNVRQIGMEADPGLKQQTAYLPEPVYEQLRALAFEERRKMHDLLMEGLDMVFKQRGLRSIEDLTDNNDNRVRVHGLNW